MQKGLDGAPTGTPQAAQSISAAAQTFLLEKTSGNMSRGTIAKHRQRLGMFESFLANRGRLFPADISAPDVVEYRASWTWASGLTRQKAQTQLRSFLSFIGRADLLPVLKAIKLSREDRERTKPRPFSEEELTRLLAKVPVVFDAAKAARLTALIHLMVSTGLALRDAVQLERANIADGWLRIQRQKTGKTVNQRLDSALLKELSGVVNGNPRYLFWSGATLPENMTYSWLDDLKALMKSAGLYIKGNLSHRFRDTAVDFWLGAGCDMTTIAAMLGDSVTVAEKHYADLASRRMEGRLSKVPVRSWPGNTLSDR